LLAHAQNLSDLNDSKELPAHPSPLDTKTIADLMKVKPEPRSDEKKPTKKPE
jgi:hypothetical protein